MPSVIVNVWKALGGVNFHCEFGLVMEYDLLVVGLTSIHPFKNRICSAYARARFLVLSLCMASLWDEDEEKIFEFTDEGDNHNKLNRN